MSTDTLDLLAGIIDRLNPLGDAGPGEPVLASDWNSLVGAVQDLARMALAREKSTEEVLEAGFARREHVHEGEVSLTWLDAETRELVEGTRQSRPQIEAELRRTQRDLAELSAEVKSLAAQIAGIRSRSDEIDDGGRANHFLLDKLALRVESFTGNAGSIAELRSNLGKIDGRVTEALEFRDELVDPGGNRIDLAAIRTEVDELKKIKENLTTASGSLVEARDLERRLTLLEKGGASPGTDSGPVFDPGKFEEQILAGVEASVRPRFDAIGETTGALSDEIGKISPRITGTENVLATQTAQIQGLQASVGAIPTLTTRLSTAETRLAGHDQQLTTVGPLQQRVTTAENRLGALTGIEQRLQTAENNLSAVKLLDGKVGAIDARLATVESFDLKLTVTRLDALEVGSNQLSSAFTSSTGRLDVLESQVATSNDRLNKVETAENLNRNTLTLLTRDISDVRAEVKNMRTSTTVTNQPTRTDAVTTQPARTDTVQPVTRPDTVQPVTRPDTVQPVTRPDTVQPVVRPDVRPGGFRRPNG